MVIEELFPLYVVSSIVFILTPYYSLFATQIHTWPSHGHMITISGLVSRTQHTAVWFAVSGTVLFMCYRVILMNYETIYRSPFFRGVNRIFWVCGTLFLCFPVGKSPDQKVMRQLHLIFLLLTMVTLVISHVFIAHKRTTKLYPYILLESLLFVATGIVFYFKYLISNVFLQRYLFLIMESSTLLTLIILGGSLMYDVYDTSSFLW